MRLCIPFLMMAHLLASSECPTKPPTKYKDPTISSHSNGSVSHNPYWVSGYSKMKYKDEVALCQSKIDSIESTEQKQLLALHLCMTQRMDRFTDIEGYDKKMTKVYINGRPVPKLVYIKK